MVAERLGHASTAITQNVYEHRVEQLDRDAAEKVAGLIFTPSAPTEGAPAGTADAAPPPEDR